MGFNVLKIKGLIFEKKISQEMLAAEINVSKQTIINYFNGRTKIDVDTLERIAAFLNVSVNYFFTEDNLSQVNEPKEEYKPRKKYIEEQINELEQRVKKLEQKK